MATWLSRPIMGHYSPLSWPGSSRPIPFSPVPRVPRQARWPAQGGPCRPLLHGQHVYGAHGFLTPMLGNGRAHGAAYGFGQNLGIAAACPRQGLEGFHHGVVGDVVQRLAIGTMHRNADELDLG